MTDDELTAIRARAEAATPGQLVVEHDAGGGWKVFGPQSVIARDMSEDDAVLFANARRDVLTLLAEVERLRDIERKAIEQSEAVQRDWLSPMEAAGLRAEIERLRSQLAASMPIVDFDTIK